MCCLTNKLQKEINEELGRSKQSGSPSSGRSTQDPSSSNSRPSHPPQRFGGGKGNLKRKLKDEPASVSKSKSEPPSKVKKRSISGNKQGGGNVRGRASGPEPGRKKGKQEKLYCICKTPYNDEEFYIGCDDCSNWFHGKCVGISKNDSVVMDNWTCDTCKSRNSELYCLCKQPYDEAQ